MKERIQKILARAGYGSRRSVERLIAAGRVTVNGAPAKIGDQADADTDHIELDGVLVQQPSTLVYLAMHKPAGYITTADDPQRRRTVMELLPEDRPPHVLPVGRLDRDTEGLLIFTNDGEFAHRLAHPRYEAEKEYHALVQGRPDARALGDLERGVALDGRPTAPAHAAIANPPHGFEAREGYSWLRLVLHEGRKRQVRRMCAAVGHEVERLVRTRVDGVALDDLPRGATRALTARELSALRHGLGLQDERADGA